MTTTKNTDLRSFIAQLLLANPQGMTRSELYSRIGARFDINENTISSILKRMEAAGEIALDRSRKQHYRFFATSDDNPLSDGVIQRTVPAKRRKCKLTTRYSPMGWCVAVLLAKPRSSKNA